MFDCSGMQRALLCADCAGGGLAHTAVYSEMHPPASEGVYLLKPPREGGRFNDICIGYNDVFDEMHVNTGIFFGYDNFIELAGHILTMFNNENYAKNHNTIKVKGIQLIWLKTFIWGGAVIKAFFQVSHVGIRLLFYGSDKLAKTGQKILLAIAASPVRVPLYP